MTFSRGATGLSHRSWCFESILGVTVESVQGNQVYLEWSGTSGSFGMVRRPLELLSTFKWRGGKNGALFELWWDPRCSS